MDDHNDLREMIAEGRSKLEWERKIPDDKLVDLKDMLDSKDFKTNLPKVINNIICQYYLHTTVLRKKSGLCLMMKGFILISRIFLKVIKRIYELAWQQFSDLPRGHHKNNSMHKLASKTMIEILPPKLMTHIEAKCGSLASTPDFFDVIGQVSWFEDTA